MARADVLADHLVSSDAGLIAAVNVLDGVEAQLYDAGFAGRLLWWWAEYSMQSGKSGLEIAKALGELADALDGRAPAGFASPPVPLRGVHIACQREDPLATAAPRASVRDAVATSYWASLNALSELEDEGIDIAARSGTPSYRATAAVLASGNRRQIEVDVVGKATLTNRGRGKNAILFFTLADELLAHLAAAGVDRLADVARDRLGLVHLTPGLQYIAAVLPPPGTEDRVDRGRPTAIDSGGNTRFVARPHGEATGDPWGRTADLPRIPTEWPAVTLLKERVCGPYPDYTRPHHVPSTLEVHFLGAVEVPRGDVEGRGDGRFAALLSERWEREAGTTVKERLAQMMEVALT